MIQPLQTNSNRFYFYVEDGAQYNRTLILTDSIFTNCAQPFLLNSYSTRYMNVLIENNVFRNNTGSNHLISFNSVSSGSYKFQYNTIHNNTCTLTTCSIFYWSKRNENKEQAIQNNFFRYYFFVN